MKIRTGFVSNSSSSSFVCIGVPLEISELNEEFILENDVIITGFYGSEGMDLIRLKDKYLLKLIQILYEEGFNPDGWGGSDFKAIKVVSCAFDQSSINIPEDLEKGSICFSEDVSYHSSDTYSRFLMNYTIPEKYSTIVERKMKLDKLNDKL